MRVLHWMSELSGLVVISFLIQDLMQQSFQLEWCQQVFHLQTSRRIFVMLKVPRSLTEGVRDFNCFDNS